MRTKSNAKYYGKNIAVCINKQNNTALFFNIDLPLCLRMMDQMKKIIEATEIPLYKKKDADNDID